MCLIFIFLFNWHPSFGTVKDTKKKHTAKKKTPPPSEIFTPGAGGDRFM